METDDYFAKMMFSSINNEAYFNDCDDYASNSEYDMGSITTDKSSVPHRRTSQNSAMSAQKSDHIAKLNQFILVKANTTGGNNLPYEEVSSTSKQFEGRTSALPHIPPTEHFKPNI